MLTFLPDATHADRIFTPCPAASSSSPTTTSTTSTPSTPVAVSRTTILHSYKSLFPLLVPSSEAIELALTTTRCCRGPTSILLFNQPVSDDYYLLHEIQTSLYRTEAVVATLKKKSEQVLAHRHRGESGQSTKTTGRSRSRKRKASSSSSSSSATVPDKILPSDQVGFLRALKRGDMHTTLMELQRSGYFNPEAFVLRRHRSGVGGMATMRDDDLVSVVCLFFQGWGGGEHARVGH